MPPSSHVAANPCYLCQHCIAASCASFHSRCWDQLCCVSPGDCFKSLIFALSSSPSTASGTVTSPCSLCSFIRNPGLLAWQSQLYKIWPGPLSLVFTVLGMGCAFAFSHAVTPWWEPGVPALSKPAFLQGICQPRPYICLY